MGKCIMIGVFPPLYGGATVKCEIFYETLKDNQIETEKIDVYAASRNKTKSFKILKDCIRAFRSGNEIIYCLDSRRLRGVTMLQSLFTSSLERTTVLAIGGVFHEIVDKYPLLSMRLRKAKGIWVETEGMKARLLERRFNNVAVFPNPKPERIL